jgi:hypothetical protein
MKYPNGCVDAEINPESDQAAGPKLKREKSKPRNL